MKHVILTFLLLATTVRAETDVCVYGGSSSGGGRENGFSRVTATRLVPTFIRTLVIIGVLAIFLSLTNQWQPLSSISSKSLLFLVLSAFATGASWISYFRALKMGNASQVAPIDKLSVVLVALFAVLILGERPSLPNWLGIGLVAAGAILIAVKS